MLNRAKMHVKFSWNSFFCPRPFVEIFVYARIRYWEFDALLSDHNLRFDHRPELVLIDTSSYFPNASTSMYAQQTSQSSLVAEFLYKTLRRYQWNFSRTISVNRFNEKCSKFFVSLHARNSHPCDQLYRLEYCTSIDRKISIYFSPSVIIWDLSIMGKIGPKISISKNIIKIAELMGSRYCIKK